MWSIPHGGMKAPVERPEGVITYVKSSDDTDALVWLDKDAQIVTESQLAVLRAAKCVPETPGNRAPSAAP